MCLMLLRVDAGGVNAYMIVAIIIAIISPLCLCGIVGIAAFIGDGK